MTQDKIKEIVYNYFEKNNRSFKRENNMKFLTLTLAKDENLLKEIWKEARKELLDELEKDYIEELETLNRPMLNVSDWIEEKREDL